ncbi:ABC transporter substrate-binding protein [Paenibacillus swuensis]|uniref:ABC transporter substrate-binding protein n=1 Tax=Paenibacillus swuensis TaxID=1178515 RepID=A0A172TPK6_9BACL|nr:sugar ABC transporter substrate-binding protein [Paenibacillus swuensis]ANE48747.1 ABC transporter substrate-binding protein [Paenibacillus swuensis]
MKRKYGLRWVTGIALASVIALSGCAGNNVDSQPKGQAKAENKGENKGEAKNETAEPQAKETLVTVWGGNDFLKGDASPGQRMIKEFNEKNKGRIRVEARFMPWAEYNTAVQAAATSNELPDILMTPQNTDIRGMVANGLAQPLDGLVTDAWKKQFIEGSFAEGVNVIDGKTYSWPLTGPVLGSILYYNKDVLQNAGLDPEKPPTTWKELREAAKKVTDQGKGDVFGFVFGGGDNGDAAGITKIVHSLSAGISPQVVDGFNYNTGKYEYSSKAVLDAFDFVTQLKADGSILPSSYTIKAAEASVLFGQGKAAFLIDGRARMWIAKRDTPDVKLGLAPVPTPTGSQPTHHYVQAQPNGYIISAGSKNPEAAAEFIEKAFASPWFYEKYLNSGVALTPIQSINENQALYPYPEFESFLKLHKEVLRLRPDYAIQNPQTSKVVLELGTLGQPKVKPGFNEILQSVLTGAEKDAPALLKAYDEKLNKGLDDALKKVTAEGVQVSRKDFTFPHWDATKDFTAADYKR